MEKILKMKNEPKLTSLNKGEKLLEAVVPHWVGFTGHYILGFIFFIFPVFIVDWYRRSHNYFITNDRVFFEKCFISNNSTSIKFSNVSDVRFEQRLVERIFGVGDIYINTAGSSSVEMVIRDVKNPSKIKNMIEERI